MKAKFFLLGGQVQGVGFRPFVFRLADSHQLCGWVRNSLGRVEIHVEGEASHLQQFETELIQLAPPLARPQILSISPATPEAFSRFDILQSDAEGSADIHVPADLYTCSQCQREMHQPDDRRYRYPFINCTQCGPRFTLIRQLPYDRSNTTMADFPLCDACAAEYADPGDRRFHAEPVACPVCGPRLEMVTAEGETICGNEACLQAGVELLKQGRILAVKGMGGYHLMVDACNETAVARLRARKHRPHKPLAVMFPSPVDTPLSVIDDYAELDNIQAELLLSPQRPIVLVQSKASRLAPSIAPGLTEVGVMLPYTPLHYLIVNDFGGPLVATSANISGEPVLTENHEVDQRLQQITDACLHHDRPIQRPADDSVYRVMHKLPRPIRYGRGYAPLELTLQQPLSQVVVALGAHMKNTVALAWDNRVVVSPHIGEMHSARSMAVFEKTIEDLQSLYQVQATQLVCDAHPGYSGHRWGQQQGLPLHTVFHHHAHASAAYYESETGREGSAANCLAFTWDGVGYGEDGSAWGGEVFYGGPGRWQRVASLRPFRLSGGDRAGREPWRSAAALSWECGNDYLAPEQHQIALQAWQKNINCVTSSAMGRVFDAMAALTGVCDTASYEGQGPMVLEALAGKGTEDFIACPLRKSDAVWQADWEPLVKTMQDDSIPLATRAALFHQSMAQLVLALTQQLQKEFIINEVLFSGGVFQNRLLAESAIRLLEQQGLKTCLPQIIPVNDAGISFGQVMEWVALQT